mgnify:CR=1 FL=1
MSRKYKFHNKEGLYFVSFATVFWIDVFVSPLRNYVFGKLCAKAPTIAKSQNVKEKLFAFQYLDFFPLTSQQSFVKIFVCV